MAGSYINSVHQAGFLSGSGSVFFKQKSAYEIEIDPDPCLQGI